MNDIIYAFYMTIELWGFLALLCLYMAGEGLVNYYKSRAVDNPTLR